MAIEGYSFRHLLPDFIISPGTQVVLKVDRPLPDGTIRPRGTVGVVVTSPEDNSQPYTVRFTDGGTLEVPFEGLAVRRKEIEDQLRWTGEDLLPYVIYRCQVGSRAFGLATEHSDEDIRGIYLPPARLHWSLFRLPEQIEVKEGRRDEVYWELEKYLRLALKANPNVLETLWTPLVLHADEAAQALRAMRKAFLSRHVYQTYSGYVLSQFRRMAGTLARTGGYRPKHAMHLIRLLYSGIEVLRSGELLIDVAAHRDELLAIKTGKWTFEQVQARALELDRQMQEAYQQTGLPEQPDHERVDDFLIQARKRMLHA